MKITFFGTTMLLFDDGKDQVLFDCHVTRPSMWKSQFGKLETDEKIAEKVMKEHDFTRLRGIFLSHSHYDHVLDLPYFAGHSRARVYGSSSSLQVARGGRIGTKKVEEDRLHLFMADTTYRIGDFQIQVFPSIHSKAHWYNNDLGQTIDTPILTPAKKRNYKEGGSYDFLIQHQGHSYLIRPSCNYIKEQWKDVHAEYLFLGIGGLSKMSRHQKKEFFAETIEQVQPKLVVPLHWDNFFSPLYAPVKGMPKLFENTGRSMYELNGYCAKKDISCVAMMPLSCIEL